MKIDYAKLMAAAAETLDRIVPRRGRALSHDRSPKDEAGGAGKQAANLK